MRIVPAVCSVVALLFAFAGPPALAQDNLVVNGGFQTASAGSSPLKVVTLTGDTSRPDLSTFAHGQRVELVFTVDNLSAASAPLTLQLAIVDEHGTKIESKEIPVQTDARGHWQTRLEAPSLRMGFYRVYAKLSNGVQLQALGSRPAGFLTYAVVPDPARRTDYGEFASHFGMQGAPWDGDTCALLGARWVLDDSLFWRRTEPEHAGQFGPEQIQRYAGAAGPKSGGRPLYALSTLFVAPNWAVVPETLAYQTGKLTPEGEKDWAAYCRSAARAFTAKYPERKQHVYQITWEPIAPWGFKGTDADLIRIYEVAYRALHEADPRAVVAGPCRGLYNNGDPQDTFRLLKLGLGNYLDAFISHPYYSPTPEQDGMPQAIRGMKEALCTATHRDLPMLGSEQGWPTDEAPDKEVQQAQALLRQNLITLGEGFRFNFAFYMYDYRMAGSKTGYGYFYNLDGAVPFGPRRVAPKPIAPAYAAQSLLIDGCKSDGAIQWLGDKIWGYAFERPGYRVLAVWNYGQEPRQVSIPTGVKQVHLFDWMGNERIANTVTGNVELTLGPEPVYITGLSAARWGATAVKALTLDRAALRAFPGGRASLRCRALLDPARSHGTLSVETDRRWGMPPLVRRLSDWVSSSAVALTGSDDLIRGAQYYRKASGFAGAFHFAWDEQALYIAAEVKDDRFSQAFDGENIWRGDSLQLAFNLDPAIPGTAAIATDRRISEITVALTRSGPQAYRHVSSAPDRRPLGPLTPRQFQLAVRRLGEGGLVYEMAIPWTSLGRAAGEPGRGAGAIGIAATINEVRSADQTEPCALGLFGGITPNKDPGQFGTLTLAQ